MKSIVFVLLLLSQTAIAQITKPPAEIKSTTINSMIVRPVSKLPNLVVKIERLAYNSSENKYNIAYSITNTGADMGEQIIGIKGSVLNPSGNLAFDGGTDKLQIKALKNGEQVNGKINCSIALYLWQKNYSYQLAIDDDNKIAETNEKDNSASYAINGYLDLPDLTIESANFIYQDSILQNGNWRHRFKLRYVLKNNSTVPASLDVLITGMFGPTPRAGCSAIISGVQPPSNIKIGPWGTISNEIGCTADRSTLSNGATYTITVNHSKTIEEKNWNNNSFTINIPTIN